MPPDKLRIYKYTADDFGRIMLPKVHTIVHADTQDGIHPVVWAIINTTFAEDTINARLHMLPTGATVEANWRHLTTIVGSILVYHIFLEVF